MRIAVYTIALNEEQFVEPWFESAKEADYLLIADTGSTDKTIEKARALGINVISIGVKPWRFDVARNASLAAIPLDIDYCIALDMDEVLLPGWRQELESVPTQTTRPRYKYTWNWNEDGTPGLEYGGDKIHSRQGYRWKHPVHEVLVNYSIAEVQHWTELQIHHHPDNTKSRSQYLPLLGIAVEEDKYDDRNSHYYARELYFNGLYEQAAAEFRRHLALPTALWKPERAWSWRYLSKCEPQNAVEHLGQAAIEAPEFREPWVDLANHFYSIEDWSHCLEAAEKALSITEKPLVYLNEAEAWGWLPYDLAALASYYLGDKENALTYGQKAVELNSVDARLQSNLEYYKGK